MLLLHQSSRLSASILELRQIMKKAFQHLLPPHLSPEPATDDALPDVDEIELNFEDCLKLLANLLFAHSESDLGRHQRLVSLSYALYRTFRVEHFQALGRAGDKLHQEIGFLGRLRTSFRVLVAATRQIPGFENLSLIPVNRLKIWKNLSSQEWSLAETFRALDLQLNDTAIDQLMGPSRSKIRWTRNKLSNDFSRLKSPRWEVHAEIQLIIFTLNYPDEIANGRRIDYIGCSRYSCLLCSKFLHCYQALGTRGCHGKLYNHSWTIPLGEKLGYDQQHMLLGAVIEIIPWMRKELIGNTKLSTQRRPEAKESTVGGSLIDILIPETTSRKNHEQNHAASEYLHRQRAQNSYVQFEKMRCVSSFQYCSRHSQRCMLRITLKSLENPAEDEEDSRIRNRHDETLVENTAEFCDGCGENETTRRCSHCQASLFCSEPCERDMSLSHLLKCNMRQVTSADYLCDDVLDDRLPEDPQLRQDYWFDQCQNKTEESQLFGVFAGLIHYHPNRVTREKLHQWRSDSGGNPYLVGKIIEKFKELPENRRGQYFPWFLQHRIRFEQAAYNQAPDPMMQVQNMQAKAWKYLTPEDQRKHFEDLSPFAKQHCFVFYSLAVSHQYPPPMNRERCHWFDFGFVVSRNQHEEAVLGSLYLTMLFGSTLETEYYQSVGSTSRVGRMSKKDPICSFDEFWKTWERGKLMTLFDKCWPDLPAENKWTMLTEYDLLGRMRVFLETETPRPSIWRLRHFLAMEGISVESAAFEIAQAARHYGFSEQLDTRTIMELKDFYLQLLEKAEPLTVHRERVRGSLLHFAERRVGNITPRVKELLEGLQSR